MRPRQISGIAGYSVHTRGRSAVGVTVPETPGDTPDRALTLNDKPLQLSDKFLTLGV